MDVVDIFQSCHDAAETFTLGWPRVTVKTNSNIIFILSPDDKPVKDGRRVSRAICYYIETWSDEDGVGTVSEPWGPNEMIFTRSKTMTLFDNLHIISEILFLTRIRRMGAGGAWAPFPPAMPPVFRRLFANTDRRCRRRTVSNFSSLTVLSFSSVSRFAWRFIPSHNAR